MRRIGKTAAAAGLVLSWLLLSAFTKAATYVGGETPVNFWESEMDTLEDDFRQIRKDGFNAIVLNVPWRLFQPDVKEPERKNEKAYLDLKHVMDKAAEERLKVILRVGYTWDVYSGDNVLTRFSDMRYKEEVRNAFLFYTADLFRAVSSHGAYGGAFLTWEDFWNFTEDAYRLPDKAALDSGYADYFLSHYSEEEMEKKLGKVYTEAEEISFPTVSSPERKVFLEWNDAWMNALLKETQAVFPDISMEVRLDQDPVTNAEGKKEGVAHFSTFASGNASYTSCMFAAPMGFEPGNIISAEDGIAKAHEILSDLKRRAGGKPVFIDQFLYTDNTPGFENNARINAQELEDYIIGMAPVLQAAGGGYAVWTYRDYTDNAVTNGQFGQNAVDWTLSGGAEILTENGSNRLCLPTGASARQEFKSRRTSTRKGDSVSFRYHAPSSARLYLKCGSASAEAVLSGDGVYTWKTGVINASDLKISCLSGEAEVDDVRLYSFITEGGIYESDGSEGKYHDAVRKLNAALPD